MTDTDQSEEKEVKKRSGWVKGTLFVQVLGELTPALLYNLSEMGLKSHLSLALSATTFT